MPLRIDTMERDEKGLPMSDTEVDGQPEDAAERNEPSTESADVRRGGGGAGRAALVVVPLAIGLVIAAGVGARMLLAEVPDRSAAEAPPEAVCWDGEPQPEGGCEMPTGRAGLRWMFPSFERATDRHCRDVLPDSPKSTRPAMFECSGEVPSGSVRIIYSQLTDVERGRANFEKEHGGPPEEIDDQLGRRLLWSEGDNPGNHVYELDVMYAELPFAVEVRARSAAARDEALERLVRFRAEDGSFVRPAN
jgi:hypothetical protein